MAGAKPEYLPVILALGKPGAVYGFHYLQRNYGAGERPDPQTDRNERRRGRAWAECRSQLGHRPGRDFDSQHHPRLSGGRIRLLLSQQSDTLQQYDHSGNEEALPEGWKPIHVQMGRKPDESVLTIFSGWQFVNCSGSVVEHYAPQLLMRDFTRVLASMGSATLIMDPSVAETAQKHPGISNQRSASEWLSKNAEVPAKVYWANSIVFRHDGSAWQTGA